MADPRTTAASAARRHARLRWVGAPLLATGVLLLLTAGVRSFGPGPVGPALLAVGGCLLALTSFGVNHDSALAYTRDAGPAADPALRLELDAALDKDRPGTLALRAAPAMGFVIPVLAVLVQSGVLLRSFGLLALPGAGGPAAP